MATPIIIAAMSFTADPNSKLLALRGGSGISTGALVDTAAAVNIVGGMAAWLAPKGNLESYGVKGEITASDTFFIRLIAGVQLALGAALVAGKTDVDKLALVWLYGHVIACLANIPMLEQLSVPKGPIVACIAAFAVLGELTRLGVVQPGHLTNIVMVVYTLTSLQEILLPQPTLHTFLPGRQPTPLVKVFFQSFSATKLQAGLFLLLTKLTGKHSSGLVAWASVGVGLCIWNAMQADKLGMQRRMFFGWLSAQAVFALLAYTSV